MGKKSAPLRQPLWRSNNSSSRQIQILPSCASSNNSSSNSNIDSWLQGRHCFLAGGFRYFLFSSRTLGKWSNSTHIFQRGWFNHQLVFLEKLSFPNRKLDRTFLGTNCVKLRRCFRFGWKRMFRTASFKRAFPRFRSPNKNGGEVRIRESPLQKNPLSEFRFRNYRKICPENLFFGELLLFDDCLVDMMKFVIENKFWETFPWTHLWRGLNLYSPNHAQKIQKKSGLGIVLFAINSRYIHH